VHFIILGTNAQQSSEISALLGQIGYVRQNIDRNVEIGPIQNAQTPGGMSAAQEPKKSVMSTIDQYRYLMKRMNVLPKKNEDAKNIGNNPSKERKFG